MGAFVLGRLLLLGGWRRTHVVLVVRRHHFDFAFAFLAGCGGGILEVHRGGATALGVVLVGSPPRVACLLIFLGQRGVNSHSIAVDATRMDGVIFIKG